MSDRKRATGQDRFCSSQRVGVDHPVDRKAHKGPISNVVCNPKPCEGHRFLFNPSYSTLGQQCTLRGLHEDADIWGL